MGHKGPGGSSEAHSCSTTNRLTQAEIFWKLLKSSAHNTHKNTSKTSQNSIFFFFSFQLLPSGKIYVLLSREKALWITSD